MVKYLTVYGMIEEYYDNEYTVYGSINHDVYTWKKYDQHDVEMNTHGMYQMPLNISDATLKGTKNHLDKMHVVQNRYQLRIGFDQIKKDAYPLCFADWDLPFCKQIDDITAMSKITVLNDFIEY